MKRAGDTPDPVMKAFFALSAIGALLGVLAGVGVASGIWLLSAFLIGVVVFVGWAVLQLDLERLEDEDSYERRSDDPS